MEVKNDDGFVDANLLWYGGSVTPVMDAYIDGAYAGDYFVDGDKIDLTIVGDSTFAGRTQDLLSIPIATRSGQVVPLSALANVDYSSGPESIRRRERLRAITVSVSPPIEMPLEDAYAHTSKVIVENMMRPEAQEGIAAFLERRKPEWD